LAGIGSTLGDLEALLLALGCGKLSGVILIG